jgi:hypothetical protein
LSQVSSSSGDGDCGGGGGVGGGDGVSKFVTQSLVWRRKLKKEEG